MAAVKAAAADRVAKEQEATQRKLQAVNEEAAEAWTRLEHVEATLVRWVHSLDRLIAWEWGGGEGMGLLVMMYQRHVSGLHMLLSPLLVVHPPRLLCRASERGGGRVDCRARCLDGVPRNRQGRGGCPSRCCGGNQGQSGVGRGHGWLLFGCGCCSVVVAVRL
jgi:hypothetical protein